MSDLDAIVAAHSQAVWRTAYRLLNHHEDALDCYQETFLAALRLTRSDEIRHWRAMLLRIVTRRAFDRLRHRYQAEKTSGSPERPSAVEAPDARAQSEELREQVRQALSTLPPQQAEAFWLRHLEQLSTGDVAELMGIEPAHVRVLVHRAAAGLRTLLGASYGPASISEESP